MRVDGQHPAQPSRHAPPEESPSAPTTSKLNWNTEVGRTAYRTQRYISQAVAFKNCKQGFYIEQKGLWIHQRTLLRAAYLHGKQCLFCLVRSELQKPAFLVTFSDSSKIVLSGREGLLSPTALCSSLFFSFFFFLWNQPQFSPNFNHCI